MNLIDLCGQANDFLALPSTIIFFGVALFLTLKTKFLQLRAVPKFFSLIKNDKYEGDDIKNMKTISPIHALFTAMATTIGMGNIVGPTIAIITGGPGALFWLVAYTFLGSVTKFTEVTFALITRKKTAEGDILGGPTQYLGLIHPLIGKWYGFITIFMFAGWSGLQSNTLGKILEKEGIAPWITGLVLAIIVLIVLFGGVKRIGSIASKLVPVMFVLYVTFALFIIFKDFSALINALKLVCNNIFSPASAMGGFMGATVFQAMRWGSYKGIFITEAGIGTSSIAHSFADTKKPTDQGILAMYGMAAETFLCIMSGLLVLVTGVWLSVPHGQLTSTLIYDVFKLHAPVFGNWVLILSVTLFVLTTVIGNSFNGGQSFAYFTKYRFIKAYYIFAALVIFLGSITYVKLIWDIMEIFLALVAIPNLIGIVILACRYPEQLKIK